MAQFKKFLKSDSWRLALMIVLILAARSTLADHYFVPSGSMQHTLQIGDRVFVDKISHGLRAPFTRIELIAGKAVERGEVVIVDSPRDGTRLIKRVVAIAGDEVSIIDGNLAINSRWLGSGGRVAEENFGTHTAFLDLGHGGGPNVLALQVPVGKLLLVGDHRGNSLDGRYFGLVDESEIYGRAVAVYYRGGDGLVWKKL